MSKRPRTDQQQRGMTAAMSWWSRGLEFVAAMGVFTAIGWWLDEKFNTSGPWFLLGGFFFGFVGGFYLLLKETLRAEQDGEEPRNDHDEI